MLHLRIAIWSYWPWERIFYLDNSRKCDATNLYSCKYNIDRMDNEIIEIVMAEDRRSQPLRRCFGPAVL